MAQTQTAEIRLPPKLVPVFVDKPGEIKPRFRGAHGGRGSGKTRSFATMTALRGYQVGRAGRNGRLLCAREYMNSLAESSFAEVATAIRSVDWLNAYYDIGRNYIRSHDGRIEYVFKGLRHNTDSVKSISDVVLCWVDEAEAVSEPVWQKLIPSVRGADDAEIWATWNPELDGSATDKRFKKNPPVDSKIVELNYIDNPAFPLKLEKDRLDDLENRPEEYGHIWGGEYRTAVSGAYYAASIARAKAEGRITELSIDPLHELRCYWDIGVRDACTIWVVQFCAGRLHFLDYYEATGQPLGAHLQWLRANHYESATCYLPHDGVQRDKVSATAFEDHVRTAGFTAITIPNQGKGAALKRVEDARRWWPSIWIDPKCDAGVKALGWYHEKRCEVRQVGLGPNHDWSSHASDSFGLACSDYKPPSSTAMANYTPDEYEPWTL